MNDDEVAALIDFCCDGDAATIERCRTTATRARVTREQAEQVAMREFYGAWPPIAQADREWPA